MTAAGIDADTVMPTRSPRYALAAPKTIPSTTPIATAFSVNSAIPSSCCGTAWDIGASVIRIEPPLFFNDQRQFQHETERHCAPFVAGGQAQRHLVRTYGVSRTLRACRP